MAITESTSRNQPFFPLQSTGSLVQRIPGVSHILAEWVRRWHYRKELKRLLRVGPHMIADIGLTLEKAHQEIEKHFWRP